MYDTANVTQIHNSTHKVDSLQNSFTNAVVALVKAREKFYYYINYDLVGYDTEALNKTLKQKKTNKERFDMLRGIHVDTIPPNQKHDISLTNPPLSEIGCHFTMQMQCQDKFGILHKYNIWSFSDTISSTPHFQIEEIKDTETP